jgi:hypothetical protein
MDGDKFKHMEEYLNELDEFDKVRYLHYVSMHLFKEEMNMKVNDLIEIGDLIQKVEIHCATIKKIVCDTEIKDISCSKCKCKYPTMLLKHHLAGMNKECPHNQFELLNDDEYKNFLNQ